MLIVSAKPPTSSNPPRPRRAAASARKRGSAAGRRPSEPAPSPADPADGEQPNEVAAELVGEEEPSEDDLDAEPVDALVVGGEASEEAGSTRVGKSTDATGHALVPASKPSSLAKSDPLQAYMREVLRHSLLTREEEHELAEKYVEKGDLEAAARLVTANLRLVVKIAYEYRRAFRNMMDLVQEGNIGLMQAVKRYDPYRGVKLSSYAAWWIRAYMLRYMLNNWRMVKLGTTQAQRKLFFNLNKEKARLSALGIEPTDAEVAKRLSVDEKEVRDMDRRLSRGDASLDAPVGGENEGNAVARIELLTSGGPGPEAQTTSAELSHIVRDQLASFRTTLQGKEAIIFDRRMVADEPLTLQHLGDEFGVSRERVRQLEARIAGRLRAFLRESLGDAVDIDA